MISGTLFCTECGPLIEIDPNSGDRICLECSNWHSREEKCCSECKSENTKEILYLSGKTGEVCPTCKKGLLQFCI